MGLSRPVMRLLLQLNFILRMEAIYSSENFVQVYSEDAA
jgi:hypothetical protein